MWAVCTARKTGLVTMLAMGVCASSSAQLITTVSAVERGQMAPPEVAALLRDCIDDLRIVFDSLEPAHGDLGLALASLRYRLAPRLKAAGLDSTWNLDALSDTPSLSPTQVLQVLRIVQEALTNVIKHSGAQHATLAQRAPALRVAFDRGDLLRRLLIEILREAGAC